MVSEKIREDENDHLESGDNPSERERKTPKPKGKGMKENNDDHLESGDNPDEREQTSGK